MNEIEILALASKARAFLLLLGISDYCVFGLNEEIGFEIDGWVNVKRSSLDEIAYGLNHLGLYVNFVNKSRIGGDPSTIFFTNKSDISPSFIEFKPFTYPKP